MSRRLPLVLLFLTLLGQPGFADDCGPLKILSTVRMQSLGRGPLKLVPVHINGVRENFLLDTGGSLSQLTKAAANDLGLETKPAKIRLFDMFGDSAAAQANIDRLAIGDLEARDVTLWIAPAQETNILRRNFVRPWRRLRAGMDGVLAADLMGKYDIELDFGSNTLKYLSQDHCEGRVFYWSAPHAASVPMQFRNLQITLPVMLDGHPLTALLDTGSPHSTMNLDTARGVFGLTPDAGLRRSGNLGATGQPSYSVRMRQLSFEGVKVDNPLLDVIPDLMRPKSQATGENPVVLPEILLGMDVLSKLHLYIAFREQNIYLTEASP